MLDFSVGRVDRFLGLLFHIVMIYYENVTVFMMKSQQKQSAEASLHCQRSITLCCEFLNITCPMDMRPMDAYNLLM